MNDRTLLDEFSALASHEQMALAQLALIGEPTGRTALLDQLRAAGIQDAGAQALTVASFDDVLRKLERLAYISVVVGRGFVCNPKLCWPALRAAIAQHQLADLCRAYEALVPLRQTWNSSEPRSYRAGIARLRMGYLRGHTPQQIQPLLAFCLGSYEAAQLHPVLELFGRPFEAELIGRIHPLLQDDVLVVLLQSAQYAVSTAAPLRQYCEQHRQQRLAAGDEVSPELRMAMAEDAILCGRCDAAQQYLQHTEGWYSVYLGASITLLRGDSNAALAAYDAALKALRRETGKRTRIFSGLGSYLY
ncbi:MAG: ATP-dependent helicase, partial [Burkholderiaceae bacterium]|nr:ATP-dependent helicase [Burkholderiaceae bacterium]